MMLFGLYPVTMSMLTVMPGHYPVTHNVDGYFPGNIKRIEHW